MSRLLEIIEASHPKEPALNPQVQETVNLMRPFLDELRGIEGISVNETVIEAGNKMVVQIDTDTDVAEIKKRISLSIRKDTVGIMGETNQFSRLSGEELRDQDLVAQALGDAYLNPLQIQVK